MIHQEQVEKPIWRTW